MNEPSQPKLGKVGPMLKKRRQALKFSLANVELGTKIRGKYLIGLESGDYSSLPNDIYSRGFVQNYADYLGLDGAEVVKAYVKERGGEIEVAETRGPSLERPKRFVVTSTLVVIGVSIILAGLIVTYLLWQLAALAAAPHMDISSPAGDQVIYGSIIDVTGSVAGGADVFVNDSPILTDANGNFSDKLALQEGVNTIKVTARNTLGKSTTVSRNILAHLPKVEPRPAAPATIDGVSVVVSIKDAATWVTIEIDGQDAIRRTMLAGTSEEFKGAKSVKISTGNAGATSLEVTNSVVVGKVISPVGKPGEIRRDLEFDKDTTVQ